MSRTEGYLWTSKEDHNKKDHHDHEEVGRGQDVIQHPPFDCARCGTREDPNRWRASGRQLADRQLCFTCNHWEDFRLSEKPTAVINGRAYAIGDENQSTIRERGFGGRLHRILFKTGEQVETTNLWAAGEVPESFREALPDNAMFV